MGGVGDIGGGCWVCFEVDQVTAGDRKQCISAVDVPGAKQNKPKKVTIDYPSAAGPQKLQIDLAPGQTIHIEWKH